MSALQSATWLTVFPGLLFLWMFVLLIPEFIPQAFGMPLSQVIANDRAYKLKQDSQRDEHKDASDFVASLLPFGNKRQNKELSSSNSSLSSTSETPNESTSPNTPEPAPRPRRRVSWPVFSLTLKLGQWKSSKVILWVLAYVKTGNTVCVQVSVNNPIQGEFALAPRHLTHPHNLSLTPFRGVGCLSLVTHDIQNILQHHHWSCSSVIFCCYQKFPVRLWGLRAGPSVFVNLFISSKNYAWLSKFATGLHKQGFPGGSDDKEAACNAGDSGSTPGWGRSPGEGNGYPFQYSYLENPMDREAWQAAVHGVVAKHQTGLSY